MLRKGFMGEYKYREAHSQYGTIIAPTPLKNEYADCFTEDTIILTEHGEKCIKDINVDDVIITPFGKRNVVKSWKTKDNAEVYEILFSNGDTLKCTGSHRLVKKNTVAYCRDLCYGDVITRQDSWRALLWSIQSLLSSRARSTGFLNTVITGQKTGVVGNIHHCTSQSGVMRTMRKYLPGIASTMSMATDSTTTRTTFLLCTHRNMRGCILGNAWKKTWSRFAGPSNWRRPQPQSGTDQTRRLKYTGKSEERLGIKGNRLKRFARYAGTLMSRGFQHVRGFVEPLANPKQDDYVEMITLRERALFVVKTLYAIVTRKYVIAPRVVQVRRLPEREATYNLTVDVDHVYYAGGGYLSFNCHDALQYAALGYEKIHMAENAEYEAKSRDSSTSTRHSHEQVKSALY
jgi:hypothetical protein